MLIRKGAEMTIITQEMMDETRDDIYNAVWAIVKAEKETGNSGAEQEELSRALIEDGNLAYLFGAQKAVRGIIMIIHEDPDIDQAVKDNLVGTLGNIYLRSN